jgi:hypothetical protein
VRSQLEVIGSQLPPSMRVSMKARVEARATLEQAEEPRRVLGELGKRNKLKSRSVYGSKDDTGPP